MSDAALTPDVRQFMSDVLISSSRSSRAQTVAMNDFVASPALPVPIAWAYLSALSRLERGWNGHGAPPLSPLALTTARAVVQLLAASTTRPAAVVPTNRGGVQFEWSARGIDIEVEVDANGVAMVSIDDEAGTLDVEGLLFDNWLVISKALQEIS